jgi:predicted RNA-binding Zn-ribbon protein involved in translation (DUF1610 family)
VCHSPPMSAKAQAAETASTFACPTCGALYEVTVQHLSLKDSDRASCFVCRNVMVRWDSTYVPFFRLIKKPDEWKRQ